MEPSLIISIISLVISIVFGIITIYYSNQNRNLNKQNTAIAINKARKEIQEDKPRLKIVNIINNLDKEGYIDEEVGIDSFVTKIIDHKIKDKDVLFYYPKQSLNRSEWVSIIFELENIGKTEIFDLTISWNSPRNTALFEVNEALDFLIEHNDLSYRASSIDTILPGEKVMIKINFHKDFIPRSFIAAEASLWMHNEHNEFWVQPLFVSEGRIDIPTMSSYTDFKNSTKIESAIECFKNPHLW